jgi:GTP cyclohydrolase FolE2
MSDMNSAVSTNCPGGTNCPCATKLSWGHWKRLGQKVRKARSSFETNRSNVSEADYQRGNAVQISECEFLVEMKPHCISLAEAREDMGLEV